MSPLKIAAILAAYLCFTNAAPFDVYNENDDIPSTFADPEDYRLPTDILPQHYNLTLRPYLLASDGSKQFTFEGEVFIVITPNVSTSTIVLHTKDLNYTAQFYAGKDNISKTLPAGEKNNVTDKWTISLTEQLVARENYTLHFRYTGRLSDNMNGFYRSYYRNAQNVTRWLASTQFQTNHARRVFPSFDEPLFKAVFDVTIHRHKSMKSWSNTPLISQTLQSGTDWYADVFKSTPIMSTYLLAFIVSDFNERTNGDFGVLARPEYYSQTEYAFTVGQEILRQLDEYLNKTYYEMGNAKMDMAAIPDFSAGAMENWGLLTYRERSLLVEEGSTTLSSRQSIAAVIAHEQAHMWFGDLVTCHWWSYTWLNEGFARYFQYFGTAMAETEWELEKQFVVDQIQSVFSMDSTNTTNPMSDENTNSPADLSRMFNSISYNKGASFIRMVKHAMGENNFQNSLQEYLEVNKYNTSKPPQLLEVWKKHWPTNALTYSHVDDIFSSYTEQVGYPVVTFNVSADRRSVQISQKRFLLNETDGSNTTLLYTTPITYTTSNSPNFTALTPQLVLNATTAPQTVQLTNNITWIVGNVQETGYYRVNYDESSWHQLHHALDAASFSGIHEINRAQIVDDIFNFARAGHVNYSLAFDVTNFLFEETNYLPWTAAINAYSYLAIRMGVDNADFSAFIRQQMFTAYSQLGFEERTNDTALQIYTRNKILNWMCRYGLSDCNIKAKEYLGHLKLHNTPVPVNIRGAVYCAALRVGDESDFEFLLNKFKHETVATEETLILSNLGCVTKNETITRLFNTILTDDVRPQDKSSALSALYTENAENVSPVFELVTRRYHELATAMGSYSSVASVISNIASRFTEASQQNDLRQFNTDHKADFGSSASTLEAAERNVEKNLLWDSARVPHLKSLFRERLRGNSAGKTSISVLALLMTLAVAFLLR